MRADTRHYRAESLFPAVPRKVIVEDHSLLECFKDSAAFAKILHYLRACGDAGLGTPYERRLTPAAADCCPAVRYLCLDFFPWLHRLVDEIPLEDLAQQRFGNKAKRVFHARMEEGLLERMKALARTLPVGDSTTITDSTTSGNNNNISNNNHNNDSHNNNNNSNDGGVHLPHRRSHSLPLPEPNKEEAEAAAAIAAAEGVDRKTLTSRPAPYSYCFDHSNNNSSNDNSDNNNNARQRGEEEINRLAVEMSEYVKDSFGNAVRLDYGSGHELHFFILLMICLEEHGDMGGSLTAGEESEGENEEGKSHSNNNNNSNHPNQPPETIVPAVLVPLSIAAPPPVPPSRRADTRRLRQEFVFHAFWEYMRLMRRIETHYSLEPAGSHGVWGLDDYHFIPYIFGGAQLVGADFPSSASLPSSLPAPPAAAAAAAGVVPPASATAATASASPTSNNNSSATNTNSNNSAPNAPTAAAATHRPAEVILPKHICDRDKVMRYADSYLYFAMIRWILENKTGPFHEHSTMLYNISGVPFWAKVYGGMIKMYAVEVLAKFNVTQHLLFGRHLPWNTRTLPE